MKRSAFMRYAGQGHEITVALPDRPLAPTDAATFRADFEREYARLFARHIPNALIEIMSWVVLATTTAEPPARLDAVARRARARAHRRAQRVRRPPRPAARRAGVRARRPGAGHARCGPALIVEEGTSTYVSPSFDLAVDAGGALVLTAKPSAS